MPTTTRTAKSAAKNDANTDVKKGESPSSKSGDCTNSSSNTNFRRGEKLRGSAIVVSPNKKNPLISVDKATFEELKKNSQMIADKTMFIHDLVYSSANNIQLMAPRRMGKTMLLTMAHSFLDITKNPAFTSVQSNSAAAHAHPLGCFSCFQPITTSSSARPNYYQNELFRDTKIMAKRKLVIEKYMGQFPAIYMSLHNVVAAEYGEFLSAFRKELSHVCKKFRHIYDDYRQLAESQLCGKKSDLNFLRLTIDESCVGLEDAQLPFSINELMEILENYYGKKVFLFLDEYDAPLNFLMRQREFNDRIAEFHGKFITALFKGNEHMAKGIMAGILKATTARIWSYPTFVPSSLIRGGEFSEYFGFNDVELAMIVQRMGEMGILVPDTHLAEARRWYNGYTIHLDGNEVPMYNPYSMSQFLEKYQRKHGKKVSHSPAGLKDTLVLYFDSKSATLEYVEGMLHRELIGQQIDRLMFGDGAIPCFRPLDTFGLSDYNAMAKAQNCVTQNAAEEEKLSKIFLTFLCHIGYLSTSPERGLFIPNAEMRFCLQTMVANWFMTKYSVSNDLGDKVTDEMCKMVTANPTELDAHNLDVHSLCHAFQAFLENVPSKAFVDKFANGTHNESFYHGLLSFMCTNLHGVADFLHEYQFEIASLQDGGKAQKLRLDLSFHLNGTTVIVEMKHEKGKSNAKEACQEARYYRRRAFTPLSDFPYIRRFIFLGVHIGHGTTAAGNGGVVVTIEKCIEDGTEDPEDMDTPKKFKNNATHPNKGGGGDAAAGGKRRLGRKVSGRRGGRGRGRGGRVAAGRQRQN